MPFQVSMFSFAILPHILRRSLSRNSGAQDDILRAPCQTERSRSLHAMGKEMKSDLIETALGRTDKLVDVLIDYLVVYSGDLCG